MRLKWNDTQYFHELNDWKSDQELLGLVKACVQAQKEKAKVFYENQYQPDNQAREKVSEEALRQILQKGKDIHGIATHREISNVIVFNAENISDAIESSVILEMRLKIDAIMKDKINNIFGGHRLSIVPSGHFWYPPGGFMGWHTNQKAPGWRIYINYTEESEKSFFRYQDPDSGEIITKNDDIINFRLFRICPEKPLWHAVYSDTHRFSFGYMVRMTPTIFGKIKRKISSMLNSN